MALLLGADLLAPHCPPSRYNHPSDHHPQLLPQLLDKPQGPEAAAGVSPTKWGEPTACMRWGGLAAGGGWHGWSPWLPDLPLTHLRGDLLPFLLLGSGGLAQPFSASYLLL